MLEKFGLSDIERKASERYKTAAYCRLSVEDSGKPGTDTIKAQISMLRSFVQYSPDMELCSVYSDNGCSGRDFSRPAFERMMGDIRSGKINCVVVKDMSRFGRNYLGSGEYIERIFPSLGVRFISLCDGYDSLSSTGDMRYLLLPLKNIINEAYSRDISRKTSAALRAKKEMGEFIGSWAPYGFMRSADDRHRLIPDPETAPVVDEIAELRAGGMSYGSIADLLNSRHIPSPGALLSIRGVVKGKRCKNALWSAKSVGNVLRRSPCPCAAGSSKADG